jgi:membrane protease YdiL (CAAX protease family)
LSSPDNPQFEIHPVPESLPGDTPLSAEIASADPMQPNAPPPSSPAENPAWNGWDVLAIAALAFVTMVGVQFAILIGARYLFHPHQSLRELAQNSLLLIVSQFLIDGAITAYIFFWVEGKYHVPFWKTIEWNWPESAWKLFGVGALMFLALSILERVLPMPKDTPFEKLFANPRDAYLLSIIAVSLGPLMEELFFRGLFYPVVARRLGIGWGIFLTSLPFALMHMPQYGYAWGALVIIFTVGAVCGAVRAYTHSVGASFLVHVGYNGTQMLLAILFTRGFTQMPKSLFQGLL